MQTFTFGPHTVRHDYPEGDSVRFGKGYVFAAEPQLPLRRTFFLKFETMRWYQNASGVYVTTTNPSENVYALDAFYRDHTQFKRFIYAHPVYGNLTVRFSSPFRMPAGKQGGSGWTEAFELQITEQS